VVTAQARKQLVADDGGVLVFLIMRDKLQVLRHPACMCSLSRCPCLLPRQRCRWVFQEILANALPTGTVQFNKQLVGLSKSASGDEVICRFADGEEKAFDLVVGCDGVKSKVPPLIPINMIYEVSPLVPLLCRPPAAPLYSPGSSLPSRSLRPGALQRDNCHACCNGCHGRTCVKVRQEVVGAQAPIYSGDAYPGIQGRALNPKP